MSNANKSIAGVLFASGRFAESVRDLLGSDRVVLEIIQESAQAAIKEDPKMRFFRVSGLGVPQHTATTCTSLLKLYDRLVLGKDEKKSESAPTNGNGTTNRVAAKA